MCRRTTHCGRWALTVRTGVAWAAAVLLALATVSASAGTASARSASAATTSARGASAGTASARGTGPGAASRRSARLTATQRIAAQPPDRRGTHRHSLYPPSILVLTIAQGQRAEPVQRAVDLRCAPRGGDHPAVGAACRALGRVGGDFTKLVPSDGVCTLEYRPLTVTARGVWRGALLTAQATYPNRCALLRATGAVFAF